MTGSVRGEVDEVERVADDAPDPGLLAPLAEARHRLGRVVRRPPHPRALREHLDCVAADRLGPVDRLPDAAGRRDVGAEQHGPTLPARVLGRPLCLGLPAWESRCASGSVRSPSATTGCSSPPRRSRRWATAWPAIALAFAVLDLGSATDLGIVLRRCGRASRRSCSSSAACSPTACRATSCSSAPRSSRASRRRRRRRSSSRAAPRSASSSPSRRSTASARASSSRPRSGSCRRPSAPGRLQQANALQGHVAQHRLGARPGGRRRARRGRQPRLGARDRRRLVRRLRGVLLARIRLAPRAAAAAREGYFSELRAGWREFTSHTWLWATVGVFGFSNMFYVGCCRRPRAGDREGRARRRRRVGRDPRRQAASARCSAASSRCACGPSRPLVASRLRARCR